MKLEFTRLYAKLTVVVRLLCTMGFVVFASKFLLTPKLAIAQSTTSGVMQTNGCDTDAGKKVFNACGLKCGATDSDCLAGCMAKCSGQASNDPKARRCEQNYQDFVKAKSKVSQNCGGDVAACMKKAQACSDTVDATGSAEIGAGVFDMGSCTSRSSTSLCPELNSGNTADYKSEKSTLESDKNSAQDKVNELQKQASQDLSDYNSKVHDIQQQTVTAAQQLQADEKTVTDNLNAQIKNGRNGVQQAMQQAEDALNQADSDYISMQQSILQATDAIAAAKDAQRSGCQAFADKSYKEDDAKLQARIDQQDSQALNTPFGSLAGGTNREAKMVNDARNLSYSTYFNQCMAGSAPGGDFQSAVNAAQRAADSQTKLLQLKATQLDKQRATIKTRLSQLQQNQDQDIKDAMTKAQTDLTQIQGNYQQNQTLAQTAAQNLSADKTRNDQIAQSQLTTASQNLYNKNAELMAASNTLQCSKKNGGNISASRGDANMTKLKEAQGALADVESACTSMSGDCIASLGLTKDNQTNVQNQCESYVGVSREAAAINGDPPNSGDTPDTTTRAVK